MNHCLTPAFFEERLAFYERCVGPGLVPSDKLDRTRDYLRHRSEFVRRDVGRVLGLGEPLRCAVEAPPEAVLRIDGYEEGSSYVGWYYAGQEVEVELVGPAADRPVRWIVDGEPTAGERLTLPLRAPTTVRAIFE